MSTRYVWNRYRRISETVFSGTMSEVGLNGSYTLPYVLQKDVLGNIEWSSYDINDHDGKISVYKINSEPNQIPPKSTNPDEYAYFGYSDVHFSDLIFLGEVDLSGAASNEVVSANFETTADSCFVLVASDNISDISQENPIIRDRQLASNLPYFIFRAGDELSGVSEYTPKFRTYRSTSVSLVYLVVDRVSGDALDGLKPGTEYLYSKGSLIGPASGTSQGSYPALPRSASRPLVAF